MRTASLLVVDDDALMREVVQAVLEEAGYLVVTAIDGAEALKRVDEAIPDLIVSDVVMPDLNGLELVERLRSDPIARAIPLIFLTTQARSADVVAGLSLGADDYLTKPFSAAELIARVESKLARRPVPAELLLHDPQSGTLSEKAFVEELEREVDRAARSRRPGCVAVIAIDETNRIRDTIGPRAVDELARQLGQRLGSTLEPLDIIGRDRRGRFLLLLPETDTEQVQLRLDMLGPAIAGEPVLAAGERLRVTPTIGYAWFDRGASAAELVERAVAAQRYASGHLDLRSALWVPAMSTIAEPSGPEGLSVWEQFRLPAQIALSWIIGIIVPFLVYVAFDALLFDITPVMYVLVVIALLVTGASIWAEGFLALGASDPPTEPGEPYPEASAIIAAYLPNEAATIMETIEAFLRVDYPERLQVIVAYNTPTDMPIEDELRALAATDPRVEPFRVANSTSKAQNVNTALSQVNGRFVGVFDADHQPQPDSFTRAWRWLSNGFDVVQGHCLVRNGHASWVARTVAVEFEAIYAVSHPGRAKLHGFGIFGGSNGYWRTDLLATTRMRGSMLTEDIDSSLRVVEAGGRIASDPRLISRELAPATLTALWNQRMRWAQGWFQVSLAHTLQALRSPNLSPRNKAGLLFLLGWREAYPWISIQMFPIIAFMAIKADGPGNLNWAVAIFLITTVFTLSVGPGQTVFAYRLAAPEIREMRRWFWWYLFVSTIVYTELKNVIARVAQLKEAMGERAWKVTPRSTEP